MNSAMIIIYARISLLLPRHPCNHKKNIMVGLVISIIYINLNDVSKCFLQRFEVSHNLDYCGQENCENLKQL